MYCHLRSLSFKYRKSWYETIYHDLSEPSSVQSFGITIRKNCVFAMTTTTIKKNNNDDGRSNARKVSISHEAAINNSEYRRAD